MIKSTSNVGAFSTKINGSNRGDCLIAFVTEKTESVLDAIQKVGGKENIINTDIGHKK